MNICETYCMLLYLCKFTGKCILIRSSPVAAVVVVVVFSVVAIVVVVSSPSHPAGSTPLNMG